jgi:hypothetical protein
LQALRAHTGEAGGPELVAAVKRLPSAAIDELAEALLATPWVPSKVVPRNEVWPLVNARASTISRGFDSFTDAPGPAGLNLSAAMDPRHVGGNAFSDGVVRALLYSHGLVLEDPLVMAADMHSGNPVEIRALSRKFIEAATVSMVEIEDLLDAGVVETFFVSSEARQGDSPLLVSMYDALEDSPDLDVDEIWDALEASYIEGLSSPLRELWRQVRGGSRSPSLDLVGDAISRSDAEMVETFIDIVANLKPDSVVQNTLAIVASGLADIRRFGGHHDLLCPSPLYARLLFLGSPDPEAELRVHQLARTSVPNLSELAMTDVVAIRGNSDALAAWRAKLSLALDHAHRLRAELGPEVDLPGAVSEVLAETRHGFLSEKRRSQVFERAGWTAFIAGAIGGAISGVNAGALGGLLGASGGIVAALIQGGLDGGPKLPDFERRHYLVFDRDEE